nr:hemolysin family protein [Corynebacterium lactis]
MSDWFGIVLTLFLLLVNAFFVGAEFSIIAARRDRLEALLSQGKRRARTVIDASEHLSMMLAAAQLGITIASLLLGKVSEPAIAHVLEVPFKALGVPDTLLHPISFAIALLAVSVLHIMLGEMVPKNIALAGPETVAMMLIPAHLLFFKITKPLLVFFNWIARITLRLFGIEQKDELDTTVNPTELASMIAESRQEGLLDSEEHVRLRRALASATRTVQEVLIPLEKVRSIPTAPTVGDLESAVSETGFSRFPVIAGAGTPDDTGTPGTPETPRAFRGYVHVKDVLDRVMDPASGPETPIPDAELRPLIELRCDATLDEALRIMRRKRAHMAVAVGKAPSAEHIGIVALEDLIEEQVGVVRDWTHEVGSIAPAPRSRAAGTRAAMAKTAAVTAAAKSQKEQKAQKTPRANKGQGR